MIAAARPAAVAGLFYPRDPRQLAAEVGELLGGLERLAPRLEFPKMVVVPHAGYVYSGAVAAAAYDAIAPGRGVIRRVAVLGPVHRVAVRGLALPGCAAFDTPLGRVPLDAEALAQLADLPQVVTNAAAHAQEHSLEVQLPFLQRVLGEFSLVPFAVGAARAEDVAAVIERLWGGRETLLVLSTDLSHYHPYDEARRLDAATVARINALASDLEHEQACGATPLNGALLAARRRGLRIELLAACNSGDSAGGKDRVVGYSSFALYEGDAVSPDAAGETLIAIARGAIAAQLGLAAPAPDPAAPEWLRQHGATFVTLTLEGRLRGCIGSLAAHRALDEDVADNARRAAFQDPRFPPLAREEWPRCRVEVSLLSAARALQFADDAELLAQLRRAEDGVILEHAGRRGVFLPQVWETIPEPARFLQELRRKAGIEAQTPLARCRLWRFGVHKWKQAALQ